MRRFFTTLGLSLLPFVFCGLATASGDETAAPLTRALDSVTADHLRADLFFIASDEMRGRDTPSPEQRIAARYIAARLERLGLKPGAQDGWFWEYSLPTVAMDGTQTHMTAKVADTSTELRLGVDYAFNSLGHKNIEVTGKSLVFAGTCNEEDLEKCDLEDRWVVVESSDLSTFKVSSNVRKAKGLGIIMIPGATLDDEAMQEKVASYAAAALLGKLGTSRGNGKARPFVHMTNSGINKLYTLAGMSSPKLGDVINVELTESRKVIEDSQAGLENVVGIWPGNDPKLKNELIIISAHYDHVGTNSDGIHNGADDNGSGTVGLMSIAEALVNYGPMRRSVMVMWVSGEEKGLLGSAAWTKDPYLPDGLTPVVNINIDMIGRNDPNSLLITPTKDHEAYNGLTRLAEANCKEEGFDNLGSADAYWSRSDHANFSRNLKIPVAFLFADVHEDYHKVTDTPDKINYDKIRRAARLVVRMIDGLQSDSLSLE
ncbi:MAG: hypothetical protein ACI8X5_000646 [Planctomycetota bacterium]|jgi:hypothetical protein